MNGRLLMTVQNMIDGIIHQVVVNIDDRASGVAENGIDLLAKQAFQ
jgi:hypothetical protein